MAIETEKSTEVTAANNQVVDDTAVPVEQSTRRVTTTAADTTVSGANLAQRVIWYVTGVLMVLLGFRFILALLGANPSNGFANFIYSLSHPFVAPFFSLFGYNTQLGASRFEIYTLVAMAVYAVIAWGLARLVTLNRPMHTA